MPEQNLSDETLESVKRGIEQARRGEFGESPDLKADKRVTSKLSEAEIAERIAASQAKRKKRLVPNPEFSIEAMEKKGYRVRVWHNRKTLYLSDLINPKERKHLRQGTIDLSKVPIGIDHKGGDTEVELINPEGDSLFGCAVCSDNDSYWKKLGVSVAIEDCFKEPKRYAFLKNMQSVSDAD